MTTVSVKANHLRARFKKQYQLLVKWPATLCHLKLLGCPWQATAWFTAFRHALLAGTDATERFLANNHLNVHDPVACVCDRKRSDLLSAATGSARSGSFYDDALVWIHRNHRAYNKALRQLIAITLGLDAFRDILERDLTFEGNARWGYCFHKDYTRKLLAHFVNSDDWC